MKMPSPSCWTPREVPPPPALAIVNEGFIVAQ